MDIINKINSILNEENLKKSKVISLLKKIIPNLGRGKTERHWTFYKFEVDNQKSLDDIIKNIEKYFNLIEDNGNNKSYSYGEGSNDIFTISSKLEKSENYPGQFRNLFVTF